MKLHPLKSISELPLPLAIGRIPAGFPSPAEQYTQDSLDLNELVVRHPSATFYAWAEGSSMELAGIYDGDLLVIDRSLEPVNGDVVIAAVAGEFTCKRLNLAARVLEAESSTFYPVIPCTDETCIEGVVVHSVRMHRCMRS